MTVFEQIEILLAGRNPNAHGPLSEAEVSALRPALTTDEVVDAFVRGRVPGAGAGLWVLTGRHVLVMDTKRSPTPRAVELMTLESVVCQAGAYGCSIELRAGGQPRTLIAAEPDLAHAFALALVEQRPSIAAGSVFKELSVDAAAEVRLWVATSRARLRPATVQAAVEAVSVLREAAAMRERGVQRIRVLLAQGQAAGRGLMRPALRCATPAASKPSDRTRDALRRWLWTIGWALGLVMAAMPSRAIEEPSYQVVRTLGEGIEIRQYAAYVVAEVRVPGPAETAGNQAFPILAGYIFGKNKGEKKLEMTAPVTQAAVPARLEMTAPVTQSPADGGYLVQFVLPKSVTLATAPEPLDARVMLREIPPARIAVITYSGFWTEANYAEHLARLQAALRSADLTWTGEPVLSRYNAPFTPWFLRRNEVWLGLP